VSGWGRTVDYREAITLEDQEGKTLLTLHVPRMVDFDGATYVEHEGEAEMLPGIRLLPAPGHTDGHQVVVVEIDGGTNALGGDVGVWFGELESGTTEGQRRVLALGAPTWLSHEPGPKIPERRPWATDRAST
jgi:N-acyl homoserine lactone hydrolase